jgi:hypothetical protein
MAKRKKVPAGQGKYDEGEKALSTKPEDDTPRRERKTWRNAHKDESQALLLMEWHDTVRKARAKGEAETIALLQLFHQIPSSYPDIQVGTPLTWDQLKKLGRNIMAKAAQSAVSRLMKPASIQIATVDGDQKQDIAARQANKAVKGIHSDNDALQKETRMVYDGWLSHKGKGYAMWMPDENENMVLFRLDLFETWVSANGKEASTKIYMPRGQALAIWKDNKEAVAAIEEADEEHPTPIPGVDDEDEIDLEDTIPIYFGWYYRGGEMPITEVVQFNDKFAITREFPLPIHPVWWIDNTAGFREGTARPSGRSIAPYSYWINQLQQTHWKQLSSSKTKILAEVGQEVTPPNDVDFQVIRYTKGKNPPEMFVPNVVSEAVERNIDKLMEDALGEVGLNEETVVGDIPAGVTSGIAITKAQNELSIRFSENAHNINTGRLRSVRILCYWLSHLKKKGIKVRGENTADLESVDWPALDMKENTWSVIVQTSGALPESVAGKQQVLSSFQEQGVFDALDAAEFYDNPDIKRKLEEKTAPRQLIRLQISKCIDQEAPEIFAPDETQDPKEGTLMTARAMALARIRGEKKYPRKNLWALLRLHLLFKQRVSMPATPASISASADPLAGGGTDPATAGAAGLPSAGAGALTDVGAQAAAATTGATGAI